MLLFEQRSFSKKVINDLLKEVENDRRHFINDHDYKRVVPVIIYPITEPTQENLLYKMILDEHSTLKASSQSLWELVRETNNGFSNIEHKIVKEWLDNSYYKYIFERSIMMHENPQVASRNFNPSSASQLYLRNKWENIVDSLKELDNQKLMKREVQYRYGLGGKKLNDLFEHNYAYLVFDTKEVDGFEACYSANAKNFIEKLEPKGDFFEKLQYFYDSIEQHEFPTHYSGSTGYLFHKETIRMRGLLQLSEISILAAVEFSGFLNVFGSYLSLPAISSSDKDFFYFFDSKKYGIIKRNNQFFAVNHDVTLVAKNDYDGLKISGKPEHLRQEGFNILYDFAYRV